MAHDFFTEQPIKGLNEPLVPSATTSCVQAQGRIIFIRSYMIGLMQNTGDPTTSQMQWLLDIENYLLKRTLCLTRRRIGRLLG